MNEWLDESEQFERLVVRESRRVKSYFAKSVLRLHRFAGHTFSVETFIANTNNMNAMLNMEFFITNFRNEVMFLI